MSWVDHYLDSGLAVITLSDSGKGNLLTLSRLRELNSVFDQVIEDKGVRSILLRSNGERFCLGMDLSLLSGIGEGKTGPEAAGIFPEVLLKISRSPKPVIALIQGPAKGGGVGLAAACDIIITSDRASFELSEVLFGLIPANVLPFLLNRIPFRKAAYMTLTAREIFADKAYHMGLVDEVYPEEELEKNLRAVIKKIFRASPAALAEAKGFIQMIAAESLENGSAAAHEKLTELVNAKDVRDAAGRFQQGELPEWFVKFRPQNPLVVREK